MDSAEGSTLGLLTIAILLIVLPNSLDLLYTIASGVE
nr:MAG TPA: hypothetical protein [Caudoviricetes sp.]